jgi:hypothetical protein
MRSFPWRYLGLAAALVALAFLAGKPPAGTSGPNDRPIVVTGPESVVIETGSVEHRLRAMEAQLLELRVELDRLSARRGSEISLPR